MTRQKAQRLWRSQADEGRALREHPQGRVIDLNRALADSIVLRDLYKKHHWQVSGPTFRELHLLFDEHQAQQGELIDQMRVPVGSKCDRVCPLSCPIRRSWA